jgi:hypothetical protein
MRPVVDPDCDIGFVSVTPFDGKRQSRFHGCVGDAEFQKSAVHLTAEIYRSIQPIESTLNRQIREAFKTRGHFPDALAAADASCSDAS